MIPPVASNRQIARKLHARVDEMLENSDKADHGETVPTSSPRSDISGDHVETVQVSWPDARLLATVRPREHS